MTLAIKIAQHSLYQFKFKYKSRNITMHYYNLIRSKNLCTIDEEAILLEISTRPHEIGMGIFNILTCEIYQSHTEDNIYI